MPVRHGGDVSLCECSLWGKELTPKNSTGGETGHWEPKVGPAAPVLHSPSGHHAPWLPELSWGLEVMGGGVFCAFMGHYALPRF